MDQRYIQKIEFVVFGYYLVEGGQGKGRCQDDYLIFGLGDKGCMVLVMEIVDIGKRIWVGKR